jgi:hypothetical protein
VGLFFCEYSKVLILMVLPEGGGCVGLFYCEYSKVLKLMVLPEGGDCGGSIRQEGRGTATRRENRLL